MCAVGFQGRRAMTSKAGPAARDVGGALWRISRRLDPWVLSHVVSIREVLPPIAFALVAGSGGCTATHDAGATSEQDGGPRDATTDAVAPATILGEIDGIPMEPKSALWGSATSYTFVHTRVITRHQEIAVTDFPDRCGNGDVMGKILYFDLFHNPSLANSTVTQPSTLAVWLPDLSGGKPVPTDDRVVVTYAETGPDGGHGYVARSGSVVVTGISDREISATFDVTFEAGSLTGSLTATSCDQWSRGASIAASRTPAAP